MNEFTRWNVVPFQEETTVHPTWQTFRYLEEELGGQLADFRLTFNDLDLLAQPAGQPAEPLLCNYGCIITSSSSP